MPKNKMQEKEQIQALRRVTNTVELYHELYTLIIIHNLLC